MKKQKCKIRILSHNAASNIKKARFCTKFFLAAKYGLDLVPEWYREPERETEP